MQDTTPQLPLFTTAPHDEAIEIPYGYCHCGCGQKTRVNKYAHGEYARGEPMRFVRNHDKRIKPRKVFTEEHFWSYVDKLGSDDCWLWQGSVNVQGYGFDRDKRFHDQHLMHRAAWIYANGPIHNGLHVLHGCDVRYDIDDKTNRRCCNPAHLFLGTNDDNIADKVAKERQPRGHRHGISKLTEDQVLEIRQRYAVGNILQRELAEEFDVCRGTISSVLRGENWGWLK